MSRRLDTADRVGQVEQVHGRLHQRDLGNYRQCRAADYRIRDHRLLGHRCGAQDFGTLSETRHSVVGCELRRVCGGAFGAPIAPRHRPTVARRRPRRGACRHPSQRVVMRRKIGYSIVDQGGIMSNAILTRHRRQAADAAQPWCGKWISADFVGRLGCAHPVRRAVFRLRLHPGQESTWTTARGWLEVLPGVATVLGGLLLLTSGNRATAMLGGWLTVLAGAWFVVGRALAGPLGIGDVGAPVAATDTKRVWLELTYFYGLGALIIFFGAARAGPPVGSQCTRRSVRATPDRRSGSAATGTDHRTGDGGATGDDSNRAAASRLARTLRAPPRPPMSRGGCPSRFVDLPRSTTGGPEDVAAKPGSEICDRFG